MISESHILCKAKKVLSARHGHVIIISDENVRDLYAQHFFDQIAEKHGKSMLFTIPVGEQSKSRAIRDYLEDQLVMHGVDKDAALVAFGGGVTIDLVGFVASTYFRGIDFYIVPTTLMAMVDAAIGGKNAINHNSGKNVFGTIFHAVDVFIEPKFLDTLPHHLLQEGFMEIMKCGLIYDADFFDEMSRGDSINNREYIDRAILIKRTIIDRDIEDKGVRRILNFGHLVGHAVEKCSVYVISHGQAIWFGFLVETYLSYLLGYLPHADLEKIQACCLRKDVALPFSLDISASFLYEAMSNDKKSKGGIPRSVLLKRIGKAEFFGGEYCCVIKQKDFFDAFHYVVTTIDAVFPLKNVQNSAAMDELQ